MTCVAFTVKGIPQPKGSVVKANGNYIPAGTKQSRLLKSLWANAIYEASKGLLATPMNGPLYFMGTFYFERPRSRKGPLPAWHDVPPDLDKLIRGFWDPLHRTKAGLIHDDARIARIMFCSKVYDDKGPRAEVVLGQLWGPPEPIKLLDPGDR